MFENLQIRPPTVAGQFYPGDPPALTRTIRRLMASTRGSGLPPRALVAPHAGYRYSGGVAARAFAELRDAATHPARVIVLGPAHRVPVEGLAVPRSFAFATPLGDVQLDHDAVSQLLDSGVAVASDRAHAREHSIEVQLPFLQETLGDFRLVPILVGYESAGPIAEALEPLLRADTLLLVSSDLSHFHPEREARDLDRRTIERIETLATDLYGADACGCCAVNALNDLASRRGWTAHQLTYRNSADAGGPEYRVVGYASFAYRER